MTERFLEGRVALVTGGARRIGGEIARQLHGAGHTVLLHYRSSADEARALADLNPDRLDVQREVGFLAQVATIPRPERELLLPKMLEQKVDRGRVELGVDVWREYVDHVLDLPGLKKQSLRRSHTRGAHVYILLPVPHGNALCPKRSSKESEITGRKLRIDARPRHTRRRQQPRSLRVRAAQLLTIL